MFKLIQISSPGKLILCGEHAVVYGCKAIASAIGLRTHLKAYLSDTSKNFEFKLSDLNESIVIEQSMFDSLIEQHLINDKNDLDKLIESLQAKNYGKPLESLLFMCLSLIDSLKWEDLSGLTVEIKSEMPLASGLGSSASYSVCLAALFLILSKKIRVESELSFNNDQLNTINNYAFHIEKIFHGRPSGIDNSISTYGNYILFEKGSISDRFSSSLDLPVLIVNSCVPKQTKEQVAKVRVLYDKHKPVIESLIGAIGCLVEEFLSILKSGNESNYLDLNELITINHGILYSFHVSNTELNTIANLAQKFNLNCKITGSGGGGCSFILLKNSQNQACNSVDDLVSLLEENNFVPFKTKLGCSGVRIDKLE